MKEQTIQRRMVYNLLVVLLGFVINTGFSFYIVLSLIQSIKKLSEVSIPSIDSIYQIELAVMSQQMNLNAIFSELHGEQDIRKYIAGVRNGLEKANEAYAYYDPIPRTEEEDAIYKRVLAVRADYRKKLFEVLDRLESALNKSDKDSRQAIFNEMAKVVMYGELHDLSQEYLKSLDELVKYIESYYGKKTPESYVKRSSFFLGILTVIILGITVLVVAVNVLFIKSITRKLADLISGLVDSNRQVDAAVIQLSKSSQHLSSHASELASSIEEITANVEELQSIIDTNTRTMQESRTLIHETSQNAQLTKQNSQELQEAMNHIVDNAKKIHRINKVIEDIAFQTNILALNAAVEAARAGDAGRGFAVVAEQVKSLAQKSADSSKETTDLILSIQDSIEKGYGKLSVTIQALNKVEEMIQKLLVLINEVAESFKEQAKGAQQITSSISQINQSVQYVASSSEENAAMGEELESQILQIRNIIKELNSLIRREDIQETIINPKANKNEEQISPPKDEAEKKRIRIIKPEDKIPLDEEELKNFKDF